MTVNVTGAIDDEARLSALRECRVLDTVREASFDGIVFTVAQLFRAPLAAVTLVDTHRTWFKASVGLKVAELPREASFCQYTIRSPNLLIAEDVTRDGRFARLPVVTQDPFIRFYAGAPLVGPRGARVGCLCVMDMRPRGISDVQRANLSHLSQQVSELLMLRVGDPSAGR